MFEHLGLSLRILRELRGIPQAQLARLAGVGKSQLSKYENGKEYPKFDSLEKILLALKAEPLALFYLQHQLARAEEPANELALLGASLAPLLTDSEQESFNRLTWDVLELFKARVRVQASTGRRIPRSQGESGRL